MEKWIAFDADDTLWYNEPYFTNMQMEFREMLLPFSNEDEIDGLLKGFESKNLHHFGYGVKGFVLSMIETAIQVSKYQIHAKAIEHLLERGKEMLAHPVDLFPKVKETIESLQGKYNLLIITKGELFHQESKIARSGLADLFTAIEIVSEKNPASYQTILDKHHIQPQDFLMIGNAPLSDILPVLEIGGQAAHIPYDGTWTLEQDHDGKLLNKEYFTIPAIDKLPDVLESLGW